MTISCRAGSGVVFEARVSDGVQIVRRLNGRVHEITAAMISRLRGDDREAFDAVAARVMEVL